MSNFKSLESLALHLSGLEVAIAEHLQKSLEKSALKIEKIAKDEIGTYQKTIGDFPAWAPLKDATESAKRRAGYEENSPLLASGEMRDSIQSKVYGDEAIIFSTDEKMIYHEFGTLHIPARPVLGPAVLRSREYIQRVMSQAVVRGLVGRLPRGL
jgi:phage gpG-like protein